MPVMLLVALIPVRSVASDIQATLRRDFLNNKFILRGFYSGSRLRFDANGDILGDAKPGYWSLDGMLKVTKLSIERNGLLRLTGLRVTNVFDQDNGRFEDVLTNEEVQIEVQLGTMTHDVGAVRALLDRIFTTEIHDLQPKIPSYWSCWVSGNVQRVRGLWKCSGTNGIESALVDDREAQSTETADGSPPVDEKVYRAGGSVTPPTALFSPDPAYTKQAKRAGVVGASILWVVVNERGEVSHLRIARPLGAGLDDKAIEIVRSWKFSPAQKDGRPVAVQLNIEVHFEFSQS
jgi:TonB family protein